MSIHAGGEFWRDVARRLNEENGARFDVLRRAPATLNNLRRVNPAVRVVKVVKTASRVPRRKRN